ncbi:MAG TPA: class I SAM-dependent methyltransferase [Chitinophagales bacterium]|nr:class I SAM-dependent methyltransferase [Chitinophagales bacterium]
MDILYRVEAYLTYLWIAKTKYQIHSPFLYKIITEVFEKTEIPERFKKIEIVRNELLQNQNIIEVEDFGAGSKKFKSNNRKIADIAKISLKKQKYAQLLSQLIVHFNSKNIIELGTSLGITTSYLALAHEKTKVTSIEGCKATADIAQQNFDKLNIKNVKLVVGKFDDVLHSTLDKNETFDFVFIDGNHRELAVVEYFKTILPYCNNDTVIAIDDIHWSEDMEEAWQFIKNHENVTVSIDIFEMGFVFIRKENIQKSHCVIQY